MTDPMRLNNRHNGTGAVDQAAMALVGLLTDEARKPPRVVARKVAELLDQHGLLARPTPEPCDEGMLVCGAKRPDPPTWLRFVETLDPGDVPVAVTRNRTFRALQHLGLEPSEVRAVVIEHDSLRVYRWSDRTVAQTMPILEEQT